MQFWLEHLATLADNKNCDTDKAAATRSKKSQNHECYCNVCGQKILEETEEPELWIQCEKCNAWLPGIEEEPGHFFCNLCVPDITCLA